MPTPSGGSGIDREGIEDVLDVADSDDEDESELLGDEFELDVVLGRLKYGKKFN